MPSVKVQAVGEGEVSGEFAELIITVGNHTVAIVADEGGSDHLPRVYVSVNNHIGQRVELEEKHEMTFVGDEMDRSWTLTENESEDV